MYHMYYIISHHIISYHIILYYIILYYRSRFPDTGHGTPGPHGEEDRGEGGRRGGEHQGERRHDLRHELPRRAYQGANHAIN